MGMIERVQLSEELDPIDIVEYLAEQHEWDFDRIAENQIAMAIEGTWTTYSLSLAWAAHDETLRIICTFDFDPPVEKLGAVFESLNIANDKSWSGAFTLWREQKMMVYRYGLNLTGGAVASAAQVNDLVGAAVANCERYFPAFQLIGWGEEEPLEAMDIAIEEAFGRA
ncbi:MAG TPA: YbjN domain-containing protein [Paracoccaceae bacterium]|nr:YbjN domain-containing protein [Paracoccaceae bacterium]